MNTVLPANAFTDINVWKQESARLTDQWHFAGVKSDFPNRNDYRKFDFFDHSVFVQRMGDDLEAFSNFCPHRFSELRTEPKGNGIIRCPYHSWSFGKGGKCAGAPGCDDSIKDSVKLESWEIQTCGELLFIRKNSDGQTLREWLGESFEHLQTMSNAFGKKIDENRMLINANWKIIVENTLENYHVSTIHPHSFDKLGAEGRNYDIWQKHSGWSTSLNEKSTKSATVVNKLLKTRPVSFDGYKHLFIFPCMTVASAFGTSFAVQEIRPISVNQTEFVSHVYFTKYDNDCRTMIEFAENFSKSIVAFNRQVFDEDKVICERVQNGAKAAKKSLGILVPQEERVRHFQESIKSFLV